MIKVKFKNLEKSELAREAVAERIGPLLEKFPALQKSRTVVTLEMENSPIQAGPDLFRVKVLVSGGRFNGVIVNKSAANLYKALADVADHMLEVLNRTGDKERVKQRNKARRMARAFAEQQVSQLSRFATLTRAAADGDCD